jgi:hypothetical protein
LPPPPNRYSVVKVCADNDPDAHSQSAANIIEIPEFLVMDIWFLSLKIKTK